MAVFLCILGFLLVLSPTHTPAHVSPRFEQKSDQWKTEKGRIEYEKIAKKAETSDCWRDALGGLNSSCRNINDEDQNRLAIAFTNCHLERSGRVTYPCPPDHTIAQCTNGATMEDAVYDIYTQFLIHTSHMCYFTQSQAWQERTEGTIDRLSLASDMAADKLGEALHYHQTMEEKQNQALRNQDEIISQAETQKLILDNVTGTLKSGLGNIQWALSSILGEIVTFETAVFFVLAFLVLTFLPQYGASRLWLYGLLLGYGMLESAMKKAFYFDRNNDLDSLVS